MVAIIRPWGVSSSNVVPLIATRLPGAQVNPQKTKRGRHDPLRGWGTASKCTMRSFTSVVECADIPPVEVALETICDSPPAGAEDVLRGTENLVTEKYHPYLTPGLLLADAVGSRLDLDALPALPAA